MKNALKLSFVLLVFLVAGTGFGQGTDKSGDKKSSKVAVKYDKGKDMTTVRLKQFSISRLAQEKDQAPNFPLHQMDLEVSFQFKGQDKGVPADGVEFKFHASAGNYVFLRGVQVMAVLDRDAEGEDRAIQLGTTEYKSLAPKFNSVYEEYLTVNVPAEAMRKLAAANSLELYLGPVGYRLTDNQLAAIKELAGYLPAAAASN